MNICQRFFRKETVVHSQRIKPRNEIKCSTFKRNCTAFLHITLYQPVWRQKCNKLNCWDVNSCSRASGHWLKAADHLNFSSSILPNIAPWRFIKVHKLQQLPRRCARSRKAAADSHGCGSLVWFSYFCCRLSLDWPTQARVEFSTMPRPLHGSLQGDTHPNCALTPAGSLELLLMVKK